MSEQRRHARLPIEFNTFIELESAPAGRSESGKLVACKTLNVSRGGLQTTMNEEVTVGAILQIGVELPGAQETLYLAGEVRWCLPLRDQEHAYAAGFQILNSDDSDIERWTELLKEMEG